MSDVRKIDVFLQPWMLLAKEIFYLRAAMNEYQVSAGCKSVRQKIGNIWNTFLRILPSLVKN